MAEHNDFGELAENLAAEFLVKKNYTVLARNFRYQKAEIDIIADFNGLTVVVEVKARSYNTIIEPHEAVTKKKIRMIVTCADYFMQENNLDTEVRFDIITVLPDKSGILQLEHIEDAFQSFDAN